MQKVNRFINGKYSQLFSLQTDNIPILMQKIPDPKSEDLLRVTFKGVDGEAKDKIIEIVGFWDGGNEWHTRVKTGCRSK